DKPGLDRLRRVLADRLARQAERDREVGLSIEMRFPVDDEEAMRQEAALQKFVETGGNVDIDGRFVSAFTRSEWIERLYGEEKKSIDALTFVSTPGKEAHPVRIEASREGRVRAALDFVELRLVQAGTKELTVSNRLQSHAPVDLVLKVPRGPGNISVAIAVRQ